MVTQESAGADAADRVGRSAPRSPLVAVVTDSTSALTAAQAQAAGVVVVPLHVIVDDEQRAEGVDIWPQEVIDALRRGRRVSTSRPSPAAMLRCYERLAAAGAQAVVSVHLSAQLSGTCDAARLAAQDSPIPVTVVDSGTTGLALGYAVLGAAALRPAWAGVADAGEVPAQSGVTGHDVTGSDATGSDVAVVAEQVAGEARRRAAGSIVTCYVHSLEYLRRGGRIGAAATFLGGALAIKPLIALAGGRVEPVEKLRTSARALARLTELSIEAASGVGQARIAVQHADAADRAARLADDIRARLDADRETGRTADLGADRGADSAGADTAGLEPGRADDPAADAGDRPGGADRDADAMADPMADAMADPIAVRELPAVLAVHLGPGAVGVVVTPL